MLKLLVISFQSCLFLYFYNIVCACPDTLEKKTKIIWEIAP